jgi:hypothetical protein
MSDEEDTHFPLPEHSTLPARSESESALLLEMRLRFIREHNCARLDLMRLIKRRGSWPL